jgi:signal transduction histidine kinase/tetratricopeptide (TPR) repeat protein
MADTTDPVLGSTVRPLGGRYVPMRELKSGGGVTTLIATDGETGLPVVLKTVGLHVVPAGARMRLEHESEVLRRLDSPRLAGVQELVADEEAAILCLVMPMARGRSLDVLLREDGPLPPDEAVAVAAELFRGLAEAHGNGVLHRDVKPANLVVDGSAALGYLRVCLVDFGLARTDWLEQPVRDLPVGTARYVSPEQAGLLRHDVDERADLYSAGAVLFELLAGRPPFEGTTVNEVLRAHASERPPRLRALALDVPGAIDEIVQRLLRKDPRDRYQTAEAVVADLELLGAELAAGHPDPSIVIGVHDRRRTITEPAFVGRTRELDVLDAELDRAREGDGALVVVEAESGGGKSRILDELAQRSAAAGAWVLRGQGLDQAATLPFQVLTGLGDELVAAARADDGLVHRLEARLQDQGDGVRSALPVVQEVWPGRSVVGKEEHGPARVIIALATLLDALGEPDRPALVLLDDCQWADEPTLRLLERWSTRRRGDGNGATMVVVAFRTEEVGPSHALRRLDARTRLELPPFGDDDVRGLVESMAGPLPDEAVEVVEQLSSGSPFMASAVLRGLVEIGALVREGEVWEVDGEALADVQSSRRAAAFLSRRLRLLPEPARRLLSVGAVLGKEFDLELAAALSGQVAGEAVAAVDEARRRHILWASSHGGHCAFVHDKLRETLLADLEPDELRRLHLGAAERLEGQTPTPVFDLGYHFDAAGLPERALPYALAAGDEARRRHALDLAERQYRVAERGAGDDPVAGLRAKLGLGQVLFLAGRYDEAEAPLEAARSLAVDDVTLAAVEASLGELTFKRGDVVRSARHQEEALRLMGRRPPRSTLVFVLLVLWEALVQAGHTLRPGRLGRHDPASPKGQADLAAARVYSDLAYSYWFGRGRVPCAWTHLRGLNLVERYPPGPELAQAWSEHAPVATMLPWYARGIAYAERSLAIREELGDVWGQGQSLHFYGVVLYAASRYEECIDKCRRAVRILLRTGDQWEINTATWHLAFAHYRLGQLDEALAAAQRVHRMGSEIGDTQAAGIGLGEWAKITGGRLPAELVAAELARPRDDVHTSAEVLTAEALRLVDAGDLDGARARLEEADRLVRDAGLRQEYVSPVVAWLATVQRLQIEARGPWGPGARRGDLRRLGRTVRRARRTAYWYRNNRPHALREAGLAAALAGHDRRARRLLERSLTEAGEQGALLEAATTMIAHGRAGVAAGWPGAAERLEAGQVAKAELEAGLRALLDDGDDATPTLSLADRFERLLDEGRRVAGALTTEAVYEAMRDAATVLLRPQAVRVLDLEGTWDDPASGGGSTDEPLVSRSLVEEAVAAGRPVASGQDVAGDPGDSMLLSASRSALAAPVYLEGRAVACLYVTHDEVGGLYGPDDERVAHLLTAVAGAALDNAVFTRTLEARVAERTEQLAVANRELRVALEREQEVAERLRTLDALKNEFVAMVAHDLRSPMASISGAASTLLRSADLLAEDDRRRLLEMIARSTTGLSGLVEDVLQVARIESGQFAYAVAPFDLPALVRRTAAEVEVGAGAAARIRVDAPEGLPAAVGDEERNWQVLTNLLSNALKFSPDGSPVDVALSLDGDLLTVRVRDRGSGIPPEDMSRLFQKFSRIRASDVRGKVKGTGLGLYICQRIVEAQGGTIWAESTMGVGSTFAYTVPAAIPERSAPPA